MSTIVPLYKSINELLKDKKFCIDEYQREYKWERNNIVELLNDLTNKFQSFYQTGHSTQAVSNYEGYFLGSIIVSKRPSEVGERLYVVDGQQRITSLTLLLIYLYHQSRERTLGLESKLESLIYSDSFGEKNYILDIPERFPVINALFNDQPFSPDGKEESIQNMRARYQDIEDEELADDLGDSLPHFIYWLTSKVGLIEITTDNDNYAYAIFETMNDRGKPLSPVDMLKAYLLAPIQNPEQRKLTNTTWKKEVFGLISWGGTNDTERDLNFFKAWFRSQYAETIRERKEGSTDKDWELVGTAFHRWARDNHERLGWGSSDKNYALVNSELPFFAKVYKQVLEASNAYTHGLESVFYNAHNEFTWQSTVLMAPLKPTDDEATVLTKLRMMADYLDIWIMRRVVNYVRVTYSSASYAMYILCRDTRRKSVHELSLILKNKLESDDDARFEGSKSRVREGIDDLRLNQFSRRYIYHLLARLTSFVDKESGKGDSFAHLVDRECENPFDIEHIWSDHFEQFQDQCPDKSQFDHIRNHVGGLLLLPADVNRSFQDKSFAEKAPHYAKENLYAASLTPFSYQHQPQFKAFIERYRLPFHACEQFNLSDQQERRRLVLSLCNIIWSPDRLNAGEPI